MCEYVYTISSIGDLDGDGVTDILGGGDLGLNNEAIWILFVKKQNYVFYGGSILGLAIVGFFGLVGILTCVYMAKNRTY